MLSVLRRRGLALWGEPTNGSVTVEFGYRRVTVHLTEDGWVQHPTHRPTAPAHLSPFRKYRTSALPHSRRFPQSLLSTSTCCPRGFFHVFARDLVSTRCLLTVSSAHT